MAKDSVLNYRDGGRKQKFLDPPCVLPSFLLVCVAGKAEAMPT